MRSRSFIYVSLAVDILIATSKFIAAAFTGSSSMISEGIHSVIDTISQLLLIWGIKTSKRQPDEERPFGYGRELYFWSFIVSLIIFILGGCISFYEGLRRLTKPAFTGNQLWSYCILALAFLFTLITFITTLKAFNLQRGDSPFWKAIKQSKDPTVFILLLGDVGDLIGLLIAFLGLFLGHLFHNPYYDGFASMIIGVILIAISLLLVRESKSLLMGETISKKSILKIIAIAEGDESVIRIKQYFSTYMAPDEVVLQLLAIFKENLSTSQITDSIQSIIKTIQLEFPKIKQIFIEPVKK